MFGPQDREHLNPEISAACICVCQKVKSHRRLDESAAYAVSGKTTL